MNMVLTSTLKILESLLELFLIFRGIIDLFHVAAVRQTTLQLWLLGVALQATKKRVPVGQGLFA